MFDIGESRHYRGYYAWRKGDAIFCRLDPISLAAVSKQPAPPMTDRVGFKYQSARHPTTEALYELVGYQIYRLRGWL